MNPFNKNINIIMLLLLLWFNAAAQHPNPTQPMASLALTTVLPPAPNAFEITRYSGLPVSLSAGSVSASIPMGDIKAGKVDVPISLSYNSGNGILVNQNASRTGMSWVLNAGGVITRTVYNNPDESNNWLPPPSTADISQTTQTVYDYINDATLNPTGQDTQVDIFSFDFNGYNGKFYLDPNDKTKVVFISASNLKIKTNFHGEYTGNWTFMVIDPKGTKYCFGGSGATETSKTNPTGVGTACGKNYGLPIPNAWYLKSVQRYTGEYIWLTYQTVSFSYLSDVSQTIQPNASSILNPCHPSDQCGPGTFSNICFSDLVTTGVMLKSINSKFETAIFNYESRTDILGDSLLKDVQFYKRQLTDTTSRAAEPYNSYALSYTIASNSSYYNAYGNSSILSIRPFLTSVTRSAAGMQPQTHTMQYNNINGLASRLSFAQDYWGYFNGANNQNLIPTANDASISTLFPSGLAYRNPSGSYAYMGLMSKITYPTKGSDTLIYEPNTIYEGRIIFPPPTSVSLSQTGTGDRGQQTASSPLYLYTSQHINFHIQCDSVGTGTIDPVHQFVMFKIINADGSEYYSEKFAKGTYDRAFKIGGNFTIKLIVQSDRLVGTVSYTYQQPGPVVYANYPAGGMRLAKNISSPLVGKPLTKKYVYAALTSQDKSSARVRADADPNKYYSTQVQGTYCQDTVDFENRVQICTYPVAYSAPLSPLTYFTGSHIYYSNVIELQDTLWNNGGTEHQYIFANPGIDAFIFRGTVIPGSPLSNFDFPTGIEGLSQTFVTTSDTAGSHQYRIVSKTATHTTIDPRKYREQINYIVRKNYPPRTIYDPPRESMFTPFDISGYFLVSQWIYPDTVTTTTYDLAGANPVSTYKVDIYRDTTNLLVSETQNTGSDGILQQSVYKYPSDMVQAGVTVPYQAMIDDNDIEPVIEQQYWKNSVMQESVKTNYGDFGNHVYEPDSIQTKTTGSYDTRLNFYAYNSSGGLLSQSKSHGPASSYLWGYYNLLPVAEVKNAAANEIWYQSFEFSATADTANHHTGLRSNHSAYTVSFTPPVGKTYVISWFQKNGSLWDYHSEAYTGSKTFSASDYIDDVAVYPSDAQMSNLVFDPVSGITGMIDAKGETTTYDYDNYLRLINVKDKDGNLVKHTDYHYKP
ncbi:hypothetical protein KXD93_19900 [Mucilaginibacter sp. BJC16-A38]|uniref:hypothetical protein n=1 Tax=Mucilaginibacter phenanthrenivorans TaxID=1234842 RepID=UPI00215847CE|nr:hypothetical protein [Mucilaginibacter phenanthrenivorans]MCR8559925.1 hypothetical protein [Mucilaginibacter phenanthrenivorans]